MYTFSGLTSSLFISSGNKDAPYETLFKMADTEIPKKFTKKAIARKPYHNNYKCEDMKMKLDKLTPAESGECSLEMSRCAGKTEEVTKKKDNADNDKKRQEAKTMVRDSTVTHLKTK